MGDARDEERGAPHEPVPGAHLVRVGLYFYAAVMAAALIWRVGFCGEPIFFATAVDRAAGASPVQDLALGLLVGAAIVIVSFLSVVYTDWGSALAREMAATIGPLGTPNALLLAFASGLAEEMFFRGALQPRVGLVAASLLFACVHFIPRRALLPWTAFAGIAGFVLGGLFVWTGNLIAPVTAHILINAVNLPLLEHRFARETDSP